MPSAGSTTLLRGFKVSVAVLDAFLAANGVDETFGTPPFYKDHPDKDPISRLLVDKIAAATGAAAAAVDKTRFRVLIPSAEGHNSSTVAYITHAWVTVYAHREVDMERELPSELPAGFDKLREEVLGFTKRVDEADQIPDEGKLGIYLVHTYDARGNFVPQEFRDRMVVSLTSRSILPLLCPLRC